MAVVVLLGVAGLLAAACSSGSSSSSSTSTQPATATTTVARPAYEAAGPYAAGVTSLKLSSGADVEVWYPAAKASVAGQTQDIFSISMLLPPALKSLVPADIDPKYPTGAYRDVPASTDGPFPLVMFSHGYAAYPTMYASLTTHLASWGYVVVAPDHTERDLLAALAAGLSTTTTAAPTDSVDASVQAQATQQRVVGQDAQTLLAARDVAVTASQDPASVLHGTINAAEQATIGHSAGAAAAAQAAVTDVDPAVKTFVLISGTGPGGTPPPSKPGMVLTGGNDHVAALANETAYYEKMNAPKRLVVIQQAGHNSFDDICEIGKDQGGLLAIAAKVHINVPSTLGRLFDDGCTSSYPDAKTVWPVAFHFIVAQLRWAFGTDKTPVGLSNSVTPAFPPFTIHYRSAS
jgi:predicted dienelactone hydrolase